MRNPIIAGNWKMHTTLAEAEALIDDLLRALPAARDAATEVAVMPPFPWLVPLSRRLDGAHLSLGAQDCAVEDSGAFTGEVSAAMLAPYCRYIIVGHSERRHILHEDDQLVAAKLRAVVRNGLTPILCVGERLEERESGDAARVVLRQLTTALNGLPTEVIARTIIAYEPVWAIGTGRAATPDDAQAMAAIIRDTLAVRFSAEAAAGARIQYGGSVNADNAAAFLELPDIDGALVGGASLKADAFAAIVAGARA